jgi:hypothetical protein
MPAINVDKVEMDSFALVRPANYPGNSPRSAGLSPHVTACGQMFAGFARLIGH